MVTISVADADTGTNAQVDVSIVTPAGADPPPFTYDSGSSSLRVDGMLDREEQSQHMVSSMSTPSRMPRSEGLKDDAG